MEKKPCGGRTENTTAEEEWPLTVVACRQDGEEISWTTSVTTKPVPACMYLVLPYVRSIRTKLFGFSKVM